jgi:hypothetical protein
VRGRTTSDGDVEFYESDTGSAIASVRDLEDGVMSGTAPTVNNAVSFADLAAAVTAYNALLTALRTRGVIAGS